MTDRENKLLSILADSVASAQIHGIDKTQTDYWRVVCEELDSERVKVTVEPLLKDRARWMMIKS